VAIAALGYSAFLYFRPGKRKLSDHAVFWISAVLNLGALLFWMRQQGVLFWKM